MGKRIEGAREKKIGALGSPDRNISFPEFLLALESACYWNKVRMLGGHLADALAVRVWEWTCLIEMATLVAPSAVVLDLPAESGF